MDIKELKIRMRHRHDNEINWIANDPVLLDGELVFVRMGDNRIRQKLGDGTSRYSELQFLDEMHCGEIATIKEVEDYIGFNIIATFEEVEHFLEL